MGAIVGWVARLLIGSLAGYGGWQIIEGAVSPSAVTVNTGAPDLGGYVSAKTGLPKWLVWLGVVIACYFLLKKFFKKSL